MSIIQITQIKQLYTNNTNIISQLNPLKSYTFLDYHLYGVLVFTQSHDEFVKKLKFITE